MAKSIRCPAGVWTAIFDHALVQMPWSWNVRFEATDGGAVAGEVHEKRSSWIFPNAPVSKPLGGEMRFERGWWNTFYSVKVKPERDVIAHIE